MTQRRLNMNPVLKPRYCPVHQAMEREECGLARTEYGREVVEERERQRLLNPPLPHQEGGPAPLHPPTYEQQYPNREQARLRQENAKLQAEVKRLRTPPPKEQGGPPPGSLLP